MTTCQCPICGTSHVPTEDDPNCTVIALEISVLKNEIRMLNYEKEDLTHFLSKANAALLKAMHERDMAISEIGRTARLGVDDKYPKYRPANCPAGKVLGCPLRS